MARPPRGLAVGATAILMLWGALKHAPPGSIAKPVLSRADQVAGSDTAYGALRETLERIGVPGAHRMGLTGAGIRVGLLDGTVRLDHETLLATVVLATRDFVDGDEVVTPGPNEDPASAGRGTADLSLLGASAIGRLVGPAFGASYVVARTFSAEGVPRQDEERWLAGLEWLEANGVRIVVTGGTFRTFDNGFSYPAEALDGSTTASTIGAGLAAGRGVLVVTPVGNGGPAPGSLAAPADAVDALAVGAADPEGVPASFSARGPTADGRVKPDVYAPGVGVPAAGSGSPTEIEPVDGSAAAAALVGGGVALFAEAHPTRTPAEIIEAFVESARARVDGQAEGPGVIDVGSAIAFPDGLRASPVAEVDGGGRVTTLTPLFEWDAPTVFPPALPVSFTLLVSADSSFDQVLVAERVVGTFARRLSQALPPRRSVFWRVEAETVQGIQRRTETRGPLEVPPWVQLTVLDDPAGQSIQERRPTLEWRPFEELSPPAGPLAFDVRVFSDRDEDPIVVATVVDSTRYRVPDPLPVNLPLRWRVIAIDPTGRADTATSAGPFVVVSSALPPVTVLYQNFPNPFPGEEPGDHATRIWFDLAERSAVDLALYDLRGRRVRRLIPAPGCSRVVLDPGTYGRDEGTPTDPCVQTRWDGSDERGRAVRPGVYLLRLRASGSETVRRVVYWP